ncbi:MAG TPA: glycine--tRNA ligase subunit beta, partial [Candidatus Angelobacter sp.]|nr:glycine--tRNA ligase subunit beta [Candidatus Angelobacter sp.]
TRTVPGARWREDAELLKTVVNLTEWPSAIIGNFDKQFLSLPEEVLVTVMRDHQKYFAVEDANGKLAPHFLAVLNTDGDPDGLIQHGNERVLRARFRDAEFFWNTDQKTPLTGRVEMLKSVTFQKDLGSYAAKAERTVKLAEKLCAALNKSGLKVDASAVQQAAKLAKTDLTAELVKEFTELQGIVGGLYAKAQGLQQSVADAIYDQYKPGSTEDSAPRTLEGAVLSIADKADSIAGMFALGLVPTGSKDPFALRRQANGIVKIIVEHKLPLNLAQILTDARSEYQGSEAEKKFTLSGNAYTEAVRGFFRERLEFYLRDVLGLAYDVVNATLAAGADDVVDAVARASA